MTTLITDLNSAQKSIYSKSNIGRAYPDFDDTDIAGIHLSDSDVIVVRTDGSEQTYEKHLVAGAYLDFTCRLKDYFSYLGPNYRGPSIWRNNGYVLFKGWHYMNKLGYLSEPAKMQRAWADRFMRIQNKEELITLLESDQTSIGHLVAPDGFIVSDSSRDSYGAEDVNEDQVHMHPYCSCGSFKKQLNDLNEFQAEIPGYQPWCIHLTWIKKYRQFLAKRSEVRSQERGQSAQQAVAWWYAPPEGKENEGRFLLLYTKHGYMSPLKAWYIYKPEEIFNQYDAWNLFDNMLDNGFVPFPGTALPQLKQAF